MKIIFIELCLFSLTGYARTSDQTDFVREKERLYGTWDFESAEIAEKQDGRYVVKQQIDTPKEVDSLHKIMYLCFSSAIRRITFHDLTVDVECFGRNFLQAAYILREYNGVRLFELLQPDLFNASPDAPPIIAETYRIRLENDQTLTLTIETPCTDEQGRWIERSFTGVFKRAGKSKANTNIEHIRP